MWNLESIKQAVREQMPEKRWVHTLGVVESAKILASRYGADESKAELAAYLHDYAKFWPIERQREVVVEQGMQEELLYFDKSLWHAPVGAYAVQHELGIEDPEVLDAVRYHTSGRVDMTLLDKIICLADYIEPGRKFPGVERIRELAEESLELALVAGFDTTIHFLMEKGKAIFPVTVLARNELIRQVKEQRKHIEGGVEE